MPKVLDKKFWSLHEPAFPHYEWRLFIDHVEVWDGKLVAFRRATPQEVDNLFWSLKNYMAAVRENG